MPPLSCLVRNVTARNDYSSFDRSFADGDDKKPRNATAKIICSLCHRCYSTGWFARPNCRGSVTTHAEVERQILHWRRLTQSTQNPYRSQTKSIQKPHRIHTESMQNPYSMQNLYKIHRASMCDPYGSRTESIQNPRTIHRESTHTPQTIHT